MVKGVYIVLLFLLVFVQNISKGDFVSDQIDTINDEFLFLDSDVNIHFVSDFDFEDYNEDDFNQDFVISQEFNFDKLQIINTKYFFTLLKPTTIYFHFSDSSPPLYT